MSRVINPAGLCLTYVYDAASQRKYLIDPEPARFTYVFDADNRTSYVANPQGQRATWSYDAASRVTNIQFANTTRASYLYDNASRLLRVANVSSPSTTLSSFSYALDAVGNRLRVVESTGNRVTWTYDNTYQLKNEQRSGSNSYNITYTYDPVGNRLTLINGGVATTSTYNAANELTKSQATAGVTTTTYDANGNLLLSTNPSNQRTTNTWDFENRLTQVSVPSAIVDIFTYNGDGQRVQKQDSTGTTKHVWDGQNILLETNSSNIIQVVYTLEPMVYGNLISQIRSGTTSFYLFDGLGSTTQLVNSTGSATDSYVYDSWGNILSASGPTTNPFRYAGRSGYYNDPDLQELHVRARFYDPTSGRFVSRDPLVFADGVNLYRYSANRPTSLTDPSGLQPPLPPSHPGPAWACWCNTLPWRQKCSPTGCGFYNSLAPPPTPPTTKGQPCFYPNRKVCLPLTGLCWESQCVCQCAGNSPGLNCLRGCIQCSHNSGAPINTGAEEMCRPKCNLTANEQARLSCCLNLDWNAGGCAGVAFNPPRKNPNPSNSQCTAMPIP